MCELIIITFCLYMLFPALEKYCAWSGSFVFINYQHYSVLDCKYQYIFFAVNNDLESTHCPFKEADFTW